MPDDLTPPKSSIGDLVHAAAKGSVGLVPLVGAPAAEILGFVIAAPLATRQQKWCERVAAAIEELRSQAVDIEKLRDDPAFIDTVIRATGIAMASSQEEKLEALRNAILNSGRHRSVDPDVRQMYLTAIDRLTGWHIRVLVLLNDPVSWFNKHQGKCPQHGMVSSITEMLSEAFAELQRQREFKEKIWNELHQEGLIVSAGLFTMMSGDGAYHPFTTEHGKAFVRFIQKP